MSEVIFKRVSDMRDHDWTQYGEDEGLNRAAFELTCEDCEHQWTETIDDLSLGCPVCGGWPTTAKRVDDDEMGQVQAVFDELEQLGEIRRTGELRNGLPVYVAVTDGKTS